MKVVHIVTDLNVGGAQVMLHRLVAGLQAQGVGNTIISLGGMTEHFEPLRQQGVELQCLGMQARRRGVTGFLRLCQLLRSARPDVVHTWMYHANLIGGVAARLSVRAPIVWGLHHTPSPDEPLKPLTQLVMRANTLVSGLVPTQVACCAQAARAAHAALGYPLDRMVTITNGFDTSAFVPDDEARRSVRQELAIADDTPLIGLMARFHPLKGHRTFIEAAARLVRQHPCVHFLLAGTRVNPQNPDLRAWIGEGELASRCHLLGLRSGMPRLMAACDIVTSAGLGEAFPLVLGEAMSCGVPCVTTDVGDSAQLVGETGRVVPPGDAGRLEDAWAALLAMPREARRQLGLEARRRIVSSHSLERCQREYVALYESVLGTRGGLATAGR